jgi:outer membrane protein assembly factor BamB
MWDARKLPLVWLPMLVALLAVGTLFFWWTSPTASGLKPRIPGTDAAPGGEGGTANPVLAGRLVPGEGKPADLPGAWPQFRGPNRDGIALPPSRPDRAGTSGPSPSPSDGERAGVRGPSLSRDWKSSPPRELWSLELGEGYAGPAIAAGRVYVFDYDRDARQSSLRCLSLEDGKEIWRYTYPLAIKRNHGMTRTVPTVTEKFVVALDSKCNVFALDAATGELKWSVSLVREYGATVPEWYAGQCPLVDGERVILAPGGKNALLLALDLATGQPRWQTPNPHDWKMTHASVAALDFAGRRQFVYPASKGVVGVDAADGRLLWETTDWKIAIATVPSPVPLPDGKIFLSGGYGAGSVMLQLAETEGRFTVRTLFRFPAEVFGATQHTPIFKDGHLYGVRADGRFVCLGLDGKVVWASSPTETFGLGPFLVAEDLVLAMNDSGKLRLFEAAPTRFRLLGEAQPLTGRESWAPLALAGGRLLARDLTRMVCLAVAARPDGPHAGLAANKRPAFAKQGQAAVSGPD